jgi:hypothetical protein
MDRHIDDATWSLELAASVEALDQIELKLGPDCRGITCFD